MDKKISFWATVIAIVGLIGSCYFLNDSTNLLNKRIEKLERDPVRMQSLVRVINDSVGGRQWELNIKLNGADEAVIDRGGK